MQIFMEYFWSQGVKTLRNQDSLSFCQFVANRKRCAVAVVCDGIGSLENSEESSGFVTEQALRWFCSDGPALFSGHFNRKRILRAGKRFLFEMHVKMEKTGEKMGTTVSMLLLAEKTCYLWNAGDGRIYFKRGKKPVKLLTKDDFREGCLTKCVGSFSWSGVNVRTGKLKKGDTFLICTDGFWKLLTGNILDTVMKTEASEKKMKRVLREVNERNRRRGEKDDSTAVLLTVM